MERMLERTLAMIKPDAFAAGHTGKIIDRILQEGFAIRGLKKLWLSEGEAGGFYHVHQGKGFFGDLTGFMSSGPCIALVLERKEAILGWRELMGVTNPEAAAEGTLRRQFGTGLSRNALHGSDSPESSAFEVAYFFSGIELR